MIRRYAYGTKMLMQFDGARAHPQCLSACGNLFLSSNIRDLSQQGWLGDFLLLFSAPSHRKRSRRVTES
jgi:hypothetical protein